MISENSKSTSDLDMACQKVGRFMHDFAEVETEINGAIVDILSLKGNAASLVHSIDFMKKLNMLRTITLDLASEGEHSDLEKLFSLIAQENDSRQIVAHSAFQAATAGAVQFKRTTAKNGKITEHDPLWTQQQFEQASERLNACRKKLRHLRPTLIIGLGESGLTRIRKGQFAYHETEFTPWR